jgi:CRP/FNR family transcriptional regulator, cyclic AMP receptor protein
MNADAGMMLALSPLFEGLSDAELAELGALASPWTAAAGDVLFRQGHDGDRLLVLTSGRLEAIATLPNGGERALALIEPGEVAGELALLADGRRTASVRAVEDSAGIALARETFDLLRTQRRPVAQIVVQRIGESALGRLRARYATMADGAAPPPTSASPGDFAADDVPVSYLSEILFFQRFAESEIDVLRDGLRVLHAPRDARISVNDALWIVLRGAVQSTVVTDESSRRLRLAGPGRCVGHLGVLDGDDSMPQLDHIFRERAVLLELPFSRAKELLRGQESVDRRFTEAFYEDVVRALLAVESAYATTTLA